MEIGQLMDVNLLELMTMLSPVIATTLPILAAWWYVHGKTSALYIARYIQNWDSISKATKQHLRILQSQQNVFVCCCCCRC